MIVQDISGSFTGALASARTADESLIECLKDHTDNASRVGLVAFTGTARLLHPLEEIETGFDSLIQTVQDLESCCWFFCGSRPRCASGTNIADGLNVAVDEFLAAPPPDPDIGQAIVLVSDGRPQAGTDPGMTDAELRELALQAADDAWNEGIAIYTVYYGGSSSTPVEDAEYLEGLTRGRGTFSSTPDPDKLTTLVWRVCASLPLMLVE